MKDTSALPKYAIEASDWTDQHVRDLSAVINAPGATPMGAYCVGIVSVGVYQATGAWPERSVLEAAAKCGTIADADALLEAEITRMKRRTRRSAGKVAE